ncbi:MAG: helix-hairpin-helix domain-containing protein [Acidimicrobiia bacterium]
MLKPSLTEHLTALRNRPRVSAGAAVIAATMLGLVWHQSAGSTPSAAVSASSTRSGQAATSTSFSTGANVHGSAASAKNGTKDAPQSVIVHIAGAVVTPGVRTVPGTARVADAIAAAGGARPDADLDRINLAAAVEDGTRIFIPVIGQPIPAVVAATGGSASAAGGSGTTGGTGSTSGGALINLNTATQAELETLPGVGPSLAKAILDQRASNGGFTSIDQLRSVRGIGDKRYGDLADKVTV